MSANDRGAAGADPFEQPVVRDKRRVHFDPVTGAVSGPHTEGPASAGPSAGRPAAAADGNGIDSIELSQLRAEAAERTADLQRVQAEYANYRKRVERDRATVRDFAVGEALAALLPVLDDIGRAREHGELEGGFRQVAESLEAALAKLGLTRFGEPGEPFDPTQHEALMHAYSDDVTEPTAVQILQPGYSYAGRVVRPARVAVAEPTTALPADDTVAPADGEDAGSSSSE
ncbi:MAG: molecular chaperone GrpE [Actinomycetota bacterium]|nr:molecular chaperone GrpE [Actinomycetota bacterium]